MRSENTVYKENHGSRDLKIYRILQNSQKNFLLSGIERAKHALHMHLSLLVFLNIKIEKYDVFGLKCELF